MSYLEKITYKFDDHSFFEFLEEYNSIRTNTSEILVFIIVIGTDA